MGGSGSKRLGPPKRPWRHEWGKIQDVPSYTDEYVEDEIVEYDYDDDFEVDEVDWPRSCPVIHLNIKEDFELNEHRKLVHSLYRFWLFQFWAAVINFIAVMATQLTAFVTSGQQLILAFFFCVIGLFAVFFLYFRSLYWAIRTGSNVLYSMFYFSSVLMFCYFAYVVVTALSLMSVLAAPLAPGAPLPVKANPVFPMVMFIITMILFLVGIVYLIFYCSRAFKYHFMTDEEYEQALRKQRKKGWIGKFFGKSNQDDGNEDGYSYKCILQYDQMDEQGKIEKKKKKKKTKEEDPGTLAVPGSILVEPQKFFVTFKADEAVFNYVFSMKIWMRNVTAVKKVGKDEIHIIEKMNSQVPAELQGQFIDQPPTCLQERQRVRVIKLDFAEAATRDECYKRIKKSWGGALKVKEDPAGEATLENLRVGLLRRNKERSAQHLLRHQDWKKLLTCVWRREFMAGDVIMEPGQYFNSLMHISSGTIDLYLETSNATDTGSEVDSFFDHPDEDGNFAEVSPEEFLFPGLGKDADLQNNSDTEPLTAQRQIEAFKDNQVLVYKVVFQSRSSSSFFSFEIRSLRSTDSDSQEGATRLAAIVTNIVPGSQAAKEHVQKGDEIIKIGLFDVQKNIDLMQKNDRLTIEDKREIMRRMNNALNVLPCPIEVELSRSTSDKWIDQKGTTVNDIASMLPAHSRNGNEVLDDDDENEQIEVVVLGGPATNARVAPDDTQTLLSSPSTPGLEMRSMVAGSGLIELDMAEEEAAKSVFHREDNVDEHSAFIAEQASFELDDLKPDISTSRKQRLGRRKSGSILKGDEYLPIVPEDDELPEDIKKPKRSLIERTKLVLFGLNQNFEPLHEEYGADTEYSYFEVEDAKNQDSSVKSEDGETASSEASFGRMFQDAPSFEYVGQLKKADTVGIIPWIINHPVSVVQLVASKDVVMHEIQVSHLLKLLRRDPTLALAFFKYVAAVVGERADRDEEQLCQQLSDKSDPFNSESKKDNRRDQLCRLLDNKPIKVTTETNFNDRVQTMRSIRKYFEQDFDMDFDTVVDKVDRCWAKLVGSVSVKRTKFHGVDNEEDVREEREGSLFITLHYICFSSKKESTFQNRPRFYGKLHLNDVYDIHLDGATRKILTVVTDTCRLQLSFETPGVCAYVGDLIRVMSETTSVERAPQSYTLPGENIVDLPYDEMTDPVLDSIFQNQHGLRADMLLLLNTMQTVLTKEDRYKLFRGGSSVTLKKNQNVLTALAYKGSTSARKVKNDDPRGLYLLGKGKLVVQREVNGRRIQFASYSSLDVFGIERFLTDAPSPCTIKVASKTATLKFAPHDRCMAILRSDPALAARFYQYCSIVFMKRLRGPILSRSTNAADIQQVDAIPKGAQGCVIL